MSAEPAREGDLHAGATDRRVASLLGWCLLILGFCLAVARAADLRYLDSDRWPTDVYAFNHLEWDPLDVAVMGSSRSVFGLPPSALDRCLEREVGRPTETVNLGRYFASVVGQSVIARDVFTADRLPRVMLVEVSPGLVNDFYNLLYIDMGENARLADVSACLGAARDARTLEACARPLFRGVENLSWAVADQLQPLRETTWMMTYQGGGQYCYGSPPCSEHTASYARALGRHWRPRVERMVPQIRTHRFARFQVGQGVTHDYLTALLDWSVEQGVEVVLVNMPVHQVYQREIPPADYDAFLVYIQELADARGVRFYDANTAEWQRDRGAFFDPDHLSPRGAERLSKQVCREVLAPALGG